MYLTEKSRPTKQEFYFFSLPFDANIEFSPYFFTFSPYFFLCWIALCYISCSKGNTRTTAIFTIKYLRSIGFDVTNHLFSMHSRYFRNALVRANYQNIAKSVQRDTRFLEQFFRNLLMGERNELRNRYMLVNPPEELAAPASTPASTPSSTPASAPFTTDSENILRLVKAIGHRQLSLK